MKREVKEGRAGESWTTAKSTSRLVKALLHIAAIFTHTQTHTVAHMPSKSLIRDLLHQTTNL